MLMPNKFYIDTAIWRDYFEDRKDNLKPLGEFAFQFLNECRKHGCRLLYSEPVLFELRNFSVQWAGIVSSFEKLLTKSPANKRQLAEARRIARERSLPFNDVFHAVIARDNGAIAITRDSHFRELSDIVESKAPEEVIFD